MTDFLTPEEMDALIAIAEKAVREAVLGHRLWTPSPTDHGGVLRELRAAFVTLHLDGRLRGCIGTLEPVDPLVVTVADRARAAALADPRFRPVEPAELPHLDIDVSVLSTPEFIDVQSRLELLATVRPGVDGLIVQAGYRRATLLPSVWGQLPTPVAFVDALWRKAGLAPAEWPGGLRLARYTAMTPRQDATPRP